MEKILLGQSKHGYIHFFALYRIYQNGETSLADIYKFSKSIGSLQGFIKSVIYTKNVETDAWGNTDETDQTPQINPDIPHSIVEYGHEILDSCKSEKQLGGVLSNFNNHMRIYNDDIIKHAVHGKNEIPIKELRNKAYSIYVIIKERDRKRLKPIASLFFELIANELVSEEPPEEKRYVTFILDEFTRLQGIDTVKTLPEIARSYGLSVLYIAQDFNQIDRKMGRGITQELNTSCTYKVIFAQGEYETAERLSKAIGNHTTIRESKSENNKNESHNKSYEGIRLLSAQDILNLKQDEIFILKQGYIKYPVKAKAASIYTTQPFKSIIEKYKTPLEDILKKQDTDNV